jgi:hypothetical protein
MPASGRFDSQADQEERIDVLLSDIEWHLSTPAQPAELIAVVASLATSPS